MICGFLTFFFSCVFRILKVVLPLGRHIRADMRYIYMATACFRTVFGVKLGHDRCKIPLLQQGLSF